MGTIQGRKILKNRIKHAKKRLKQRHGLYLDDYEYMRLVDQIIDGQSKFIMRFTRRRTLHKVLHNYQWLPVVYSSKSKVIITVYTNKWIKGSGKKTYIKSKFKKPKKKFKIRIPWQVRNKYSKQDQECEYY